MGIFSIILPYVVSSFLFQAGDGIMYLIGLGIAFVISIIGIIVAAVSIKKARDYGDGKVKGIIGLITSIVGALSCLILFLVFGSIIFLAMNL